jgi:N-acetylmuramoyl-L-alanine amidase
MVAYVIMTDILTNIQSSNFDTRTPGCAPQFVLLHYTEMLFDNALAKLCDKNAKVSAHYIIKKTGEIYNLVPDEYRAWHAGLSYWKGMDKLNDHSIGIEIDNMGNEAFTAPQMQSCIDHP